MQAKEFKSNIFPIQQYERSLLSFSNVLKIKWIVLFYFSEQWFLLFIFSLIRVTLFIKVCSIVLANLLFIWTFSKSNIPNKHVCIIIEITFSWISGAFLLDTVILFQKNTSVSEIRINQPRYTYIFVISLFNLFILLLGIPSTFFLTSGYVYINYLLFIHSFINGVPINF